MTASLDKETEKQKDGAKGVRTSLCFTKASSGNAHREGRRLRDRPRRSHERRTQAACLSRLTGSPSLISSESPLNAHLKILMILFVSSYAAFRHRSCCCRR